MSIALNVSDERDAQELIKAMRDQRRKEQGFDLEWDEYQDSKSGKQAESEVL